MSPEFEQLSELQNNPDSFGSGVSDWEGAVPKQGRAVIGRARTNGPNRGSLKEQVAVRYSPNVLAAFRAIGVGCHAVAAHQNRVKSRPRSFAHDDECVRSFYNSDPPRPVRHHPLQICSYKSTT
jgi:hypothetical protein